MPWSWRCVVLRVSHSCLDIPRLAKFFKRQNLSTNQGKYPTFDELFFLTLPNIHFANSGRFVPRRPNFALIRYNWRENSILLARVKTSQTWRCCGASSRRRSPPPSSQLQAGVGRLSGWRGLQNVNEMLLMMGTRMVLHFVIKSVPESGSE